MLLIVHIVRLGDNMERLIAYEPINQKRDGSYRKIEIQIANPELAKQKVTLTHRQGYFAKTDKKK